MFFGCGSEGCSRGLLVPAVAELGDFSLLKGEQRAALAAYVQLLTPPDRSFIKRSGTPRLATGPRRLQRQWKVSRSHQLAQGICLICFDGGRRFTWPEYFPIPPLPNICNELFARLILNDCAGFSGVFGWREKKQQQPLFKTILL